MFLYNMFCSHGVAIIGSVLVRVNSTVSECVRALRSTASWGSLLEVQLQTSDKFCPILHCKYDVQICAVVSLSDFAHLPIAFRSSQSAQISFDNLT